MLVISTSEDEHVLITSSAGVIIFWGLCIVIFYTVIQSDTDTTGRLTEESNIELLDKFKFTDLNLKVDKW